MTRDTRMVFDDIAFEEAYIMLEHLENFELEKEYE